MYVKITPIDVKGDSTGFIPNQVKNKNTIKNLQKENVLMYVLLNWVMLFFNERGYMIIIDMIKAKTPPNLLGIDRKMA